MYVPSYPCSIWTLRAPCSMPSAPSGSSMTASIETNSVTTILPMDTSVSGISRETLRSSSQQVRELVEHGRPAVVGLGTAGLADNVARHLGPVAEVRERDGDHEIPVAVTPDEPLGLHDLEDRKSTR